MSEQGEQVSAHQQEAQAGVTSLGGAVGGVMGSVAARRRQQSVGQTQERRWDGTQGLNDGPCPYCAVTGKTAGWVRNPDVIDPADPRWGKFESETVPAHQAHYQRCRHCKRPRSEARLEKMYHTTMLGRAVYRHMTFESFVPRAEQFGAWTRCKHYAHEPHQRPLLTLCGPTGSGKSHLAAAICQRYAQVSDVPLFFTAQEMLTRLQDSFQRERESARQRDDVHDLTTAQVLDMFTTAPLLCIDEVGAHYGTDWSQSQLYEIVNRRYVEGRPTIITTNVPVDAMGQRPGMPSGDRRWSSRLLDRERSSVLVVNAPDMRLHQPPAQPATGPSFAHQAKPTPYHMVEQETVVCLMCHCRPCYDLDGARCPMTGSEAG